MNGYKIIDLGGITLESGEYTGEIEGVFDRIDKSDKPIIITGIKDVKPAHVTFFKYQDGADTFAYLGFLGLSNNGIQTINIASNDNVDIAIAN